MHLINRLGRNVLITPDEVIFHAATDQEIDARQILQNIIVAEERFIANTLGDKFYEDFISKKNVKITANNRAAMLVKINATLLSLNKTEITLNDIPVGSIINAIELVENEWYVKLWDRFLWKLTAECVDMMTIVPSWLRHTSSGQQLNNPNAFGGNGAASASGSQKDVQFKIDTFLRDRIDPLTERMRLWICQNKEKFTLYEKSCGDLECGGQSGSNPDGISHLGKTNFILGLYND
jgi:hypothetical protein